ncbi:porin [Candidatus Methylopumilus universalis]|uniref:porin n=1 Tax=Candidatus Methylopumilus universalis TaxID=2588536 RepID=UPI003BEF2CC8
MNKNIKLAVAGAVLALSASANAGIIIPAGDWTLDIGGNVNTFVTSTRSTGAAGLGGGIYGAYDANSTGAKTESNITTGLLPNYLSVSGSTRQNDLDVAFTISINPGSSTTRSGIQSANQENRQAFLTFGDKSWGTILIGKNIGIFAQDAILNDMTLLGVGRGAGGLAGNTTTTGRIGSGFMYADWKAQANYTTPNMGGFQATVGVSQAWNAWSISDAAAADTSATSYSSTSASSTGRGESTPAMDFKASYSFASGDVTGKVWTSATRQKVKTLTVYTTGSSAPVGAGADDSAYAADVGANVNVAGFGLTGYYYDGRGIGQTHQLLDGFAIDGKRRDSNGGYVQGTYVLPTKTKLGVAWGESNLDRANASDTIGDTKDELWTVGAYHPLTKHLNLVAEYNHATHEVRNASAAGDNGELKAKNVSLGAILFF